jgi:hypothetical protein
VASYSAPSHRSELYRSPDYTHNNTAFPLLCALHAHQRPSCNSTLGEPETIFVTSTEPPATFSGPISSANSLASSATSSAPPRTIIQTLLLIDGKTMVESNGKTVPYGTAAATSTAGAGGGNSTGGSGNSSEGTGSADGNGGKAGKLCWLHCPSTRGN